MSIDQNLNKMKKLIFSLTTIMIFANSGLIAQEEDTGFAIGKMEFVLNLGVIESGNDYDDINFSNGLGMSIGVLAERNMCRFFNLGLHLGYTGANEHGDPDTWSANYDYFASIIDLGLQGRFKFANGAILDENSSIKPSIIFGGGVAYISASGNNTQGEWSDSFVSPKVNAGIGVEYVLNSNFSIGLQTEIQYYFTDEIDGHIATFPELDIGTDIFAATSLTVRYTPGQ